MSSFSKHISHFYNTVLRLAVMTFAFPISVHAQAPAQYRALPGAAEKTYLHIDRSFYMTGETIWFKAYTVTNGNHLPSGISKAAYVELLDTKYSPLLQAKIEIENGSGNGSWVIPGSIPTGVYQIRAYTQWQQLQDPGTWFNKSITIVNPDKGLSPASTGTTSRISFYPEGGELVAGLKGQLAFLLLGEDGKPVEGNGELLNAANETVTRFQTAHDGMGAFRFIPGNGERYTARITTEKGKTFTAALPEVQATGWVLHYEQGAAQPLEVSFNGDFKERFQLVVHNGEKTLKAFSGQSSREPVRFPLSLGELPFGISYVTLFNQSGQAVAERLLFHKPDAEPVNFRTDSTEYHQRSKISVTLQDSAATDLSAAIFRTDLLQKAPDENILHYIYLTAHLNGFRQSADFYFSENAGSGNAADLLLLTYGWRSFQQAAYKKPFTSTPEYGGHQITGTITDKRTGKPAPGIAVYLSVPGERFHFSNCISDAQGNIRFEFQRVYGTENIIVQTQQSKDSTYQITIHNPFSTAKGEPVLPVLPFDASARQQLETYAQETTLQQAFTARQTTAFFLPGLKDTTPFYGRPDKTYQLDDYVRFTTMEEVMREYVAEVMVRKSQGEFRYRVLNTPFRSFFDGNPLVLLDGVPVFNINKIIAFDPLKVRKMDILARRFYQGAIAFDGIVSYSTYEGNLGGFELDPSALIIDYPSLQLQRQFNAPVYETPEQRNSPLADLRHLLYWNPYLKTDSKGALRFNCYTNDLPGKYVVVLQGLSSSGKPVYGIRTIEIK